MTSGGLTMAEAWNLQLQGKVARLEADLADAEKHLRAVTRDPDLLAGGRAHDFLQRMESNRKRAAEQVADIDALLSQQVTHDDNL